MVIPFASGSSFTGEEAVEIVLPGSPPLVRELLDRLRSYGARAAEPGEFTRRAFLSGRIDLTRAESVAELIAAESREAVVAARRGLEGGVARTVDRFGDQLHDLLAEIEAGLDFSEQEVALPDPELLGARVRALVSELHAFLESSRGSAREDGVLRAVLTGRSNAGKSSLFNRLVGEERAIVSDVHGTTRDPVRARISDLGREWELVDLAGQLEGGGEIERASLDLASRAVAEADAVLYVVDGTRPRTDWEGEWSDLDGALRERAQLVVNKVDRADSGEAESGGPPAIRASAHTGEGVDAIRGWLRACGRERGEARGETVRFNHRQRSGLTECAAVLAALDAELGVLCVSPELIVEELRRALAPLREVTGDVTTEDTLDRIFARFCLGK